jgi:beta-lactamase class D
MEAVLTHELAHIKRFDYPVNLLQTVIEALMFYHPAVRWISRTIRLEREQACDDLAITVTGDVLTYARALVETERLRAGSKPGLAMAVNGGSLSLRIRRLVKADHVPYRTPLLVLTALTVLALCCVFVGAKAVFSKSEFLPEDRLLGKPLALPSMEPRGILSSQRIDNADDAVANIARDNTAGEDPSVRQIVLDALGDRQGTVVVMDPQTGRIFSIVNQDWALRRAWNPASTVKLITALAAVEENLVDPAEKMRSQKKNHPLDLTDALALSDNNYFRELGKRVGSIVFTRYASRLGLGERTGITSEGEIAGYLPDAVAGTDSGRLEAFGEGIDATPIQLATMVAALANGGKLLVPQIPGPNGASQIEPIVRRQLEISDRSIKHVIAGMVGAVEYGTAVHAQYSQYAVVGKTGTLDLKGQNTGLFVSYAPADKPRVVVVVAIKGDNSTGAKAAGIAGTIYKGLGHVI